MSSLKGWAMFQSDGIAIVFRLINFGALISAGLYLFYTKLLGPIREQIKEQEVFWRNLKQNRKSLIEHQKKLNEEITLQDEYAQQLIEKISRWRSETERQRIALIKEKKQYADRAERRAKKQANEYQIRLVINKAVPIAFGQVRHELDEKFADIKTAKKYLAQVIEQLHEGVS